MSYTSLFFGVSGRFTRSRAWIGFGMCVFLRIAGASTLSLFGRAIPALNWPLFALDAGVALYVFYLLVTIGIRRCHDRDRPGWWLLLGLTVIGILYLIFELGFLRGTIGANKFGVDPLQDTEGVLRAFDAQRCEGPICLE